MSEKFWKLCEARALLHAGTTEHLPRAIFLMREANNLPGSAWWRWVKPNEIFVFDTIADRSLEMEIQKSHGRPIRIYFDCRGGNLKASLDISRSIMAHGAIEGLVIGDCGSAANLLFTACATRQANPSAEFTIHSALTTCTGYADKLRAAADDIEKATGEFVEIFSARTGISKAEALAWWTGEEFVLNAAAALAKGLVDSIIEDTPKLIRPASPVCLGEDAEQKIAIELAQEIQRLIPQTREPAMLQPWLNKWRQQSEFDGPTVYALECFRALGSLNISNPAAIAEILTCPTLTKN